jgi:hypothetical protein
MQNCNSTMAEIIQLRYMNAGLGEISTYAGDGQGDGDLRSKYMQGDGGVS